ncbi:AAA family ATPase [Methanosarcina mazei]|uniref:Endonuclease GajA/Old nuclease/RecF-like AAA domain-containing protein n=1 Tax=Methanosarcina mazei S-6 TaxID=213585 RepID=A0A0E3RHE8_METMZ|nr:AAA family ATPase [Methanosarcina mazei]AKB64373.1 hypothetical protein MSMAS_1177 [Methanosarcina mazei S-6]
MIILYVDNFRGFHETYIPFTNVNFLMGENSTGKSSILSLLNLLDNTGFWLNQKFNYEDIHLGSFSEIADSNIDKNFFKIGVFGLNSKPTKGEDSYKSIFMKFENDKGLPYITDFSYISKDHTVIANIGKKSIKYKVKEISTIPEDPSEALTFFKNWIQEVDINIKNKGYNIIKIPSRTPLPIIGSFIEAELETKKKETTDPSNKAKVASQLNHVIFPSFIGKFCWIAPIRAKPKRTYDNYGVSPSSEGDHAPYLLNRFLNFSKSSNKKDVLSSIESFGVQSGLFDSINTVPFGKDETSPFQLDIILNNKNFKISNVGYGVSQALPIIVEIISRSKNTSYAIQQPEVHLHPRAQAALGEFIYSMHLAESKNFVIETHSEYLINRFRIKISQNESKKVDSQVLFFERTDNGNKVHIIEIDNKGRYSEDQPEAFMNFFVKEELDLLEIF